MERKEFLRWLHTEETGGEEGGKVGRRKQSMVHFYILHTIYRVCRCISSDGTIPYIVMLA